MTVNDRYRVGDPQCGVVTTARSLMQAQAQARIHAAECIWGAPVEFYDRMAHAWPSQPVDTGRWGEGLQVWCGWRVSCLLCALFTAGQWLLAPGSWLRGAVVFPQLVRVVAV